MGYLRVLIEMIFLVGIAYLFSGNKKKIDWRLVGIGLLLQLVFALLITKVSLVADGFDWISAKFVKFLSFSTDGAKFLFGDLARIN